MLVDGDAALRAALVIRRLLREYINSLAEQAGAAAPEALAAQLNLLLDGAIVEAHVSANKHAASLAKLMAAVCVERALA